MVRLRSNLLWCVGYIFQFKVLLLTIRFSLAVYNEGARNIFLQPSDRVTATINNTVGRGSFYKLTSPTGGE
jgi:hypothetical protein